MKDEVQTKIADTVKELNEIWDQVEMDEQVDWLSHSLYSTSAFFFFPTFLHTISRKEVWATKDLLD